VYGHFSSSVLCEPSSPSCPPHWCRISSPFPEQGSTTSVVPYFHFTLPRATQKRPQCGQLPRATSTGSATRITLQTPMCWHVGKNITKKYIDSPRWRVVQVDSQDGGWHEAVRPLSRSLWADPLATPPIAPSAASSSSVARNANAPTSTSAERKHNRRATAIEVRLTSPPRPGSRLMSC
jgi:hypothetical protein